MFIFKSKRKICPIILNKSDNAYEQECCVICNKTFINNNYISLPCKHIFHEECILKWFDKKMNCPICNIKLKWELNQKIKEHK